MHRSVIHIFILCALLILCSGCYLIYPLEPTFDQGMSEDAQMADSTQIDPVDASVDSGDLPQDIPADLPPDLVVLPVDVPPDLTPTPDMPAPFDPETQPMKILFIGNSFTHQGPVPTFVQTLATRAGWPTPEVTYVAPGGQALSYHRQSPETLQAVDTGGWQVVVLQDRSDRPTDNIGDPGGFKQDALWFFERVQSTNPGARVVLYMTWARHPDHSFYPDSFADPDEMQDQLATHYRDAAERVIPEGNQTPDGASLVALSPVGEVWRHQLGSANPVRLHADDDYHANTAGRWLNALTLYATIYRRRVTDLFIEELDVPTQQSLTRSVDEVHPQDLPGGPDGQPFSPIEQPDSFDVGESILIDFGPNETRTMEPGWNNANIDTDRVVGLLESSGGTTDITLQMGKRFSGMNGAGIASNTVGYPGEATQDSIWSGDLGGTHEVAVTMQGSIKLLGLDPQGAYRVKVFASRRNPDESFGRLGRYQIGDQSQDFDVTDNVDGRVDFTSVSPATDGSIELTVNVSPDGASRYAYLGVLEVTRLE